MTDKSSKPERGKASAPSRWAAWQPARFRWCPERRAAPHTRFR
ncbi:hypothetical protein [Nesterenkonia pannonica]|nr:hypothetical protein [Nesterenkonia pannonica]